MIAVDNTLLKDVAACDLRAVLRHVHGYTNKEDSAALACGTAIHEALAAQWSQDGRDPMEAFVTSYRGFADEHVAPHLGTVPYLERYSFDNVAKILTSYLQTRPLHQLPFDVLPEWVETPFDPPVPLTDNLGMTGKMDGLVRDHITKQLYVCDHKTSGDIGPHRMRKYKMDSQMSGYPFMAAAVVGEPIAGAYINAIGITKIPSSDRKCAKHAPMKFSECGPVKHVEFALLQFDRSPEQIAVWRANAILLGETFLRLKDTHDGHAERLHLAATQGTFTNACEYCPFREFCENGRHIETVKTTLVHQPWSPLEV